MRYPIWMKEPLKILQVSRVYWPGVGGMERVVQTLAEQLACRGHQSHVLTLNRSFEEGALLEAEERKSGVEIKRVPYFGSTRYPLAPRIRSFASNYDVIHVHGVDFMLDWMVLNRPFHRKPIVLSTHGGFFHTQRQRRLKALWFRTLTALTLRGVSRVLCCSEQDLERFSVVSSRCQLFPNHIELGAFLSLNRRPTVGRFVCLGRVDVHKGHHHLLKALAALKGLDSRPFQVEVIGPGNALIRRLTAQRDALGLTEQVVFRGLCSHEEKLEALQHAELCVFPSEYEGFGIAALEAMAAGCPSVLNDIAPFRSLFTDSALGSFTSFSDPGEAARAMMGCRDRAERENQTQSGLLRAHARAQSNQGNAERFEEVYRQVLKSAEKMAGDPG
jgi:alpha-1,3-mannosyltransferase